MDSHFDGSFDGALLYAETSLSTSAGHNYHQGLAAAQKKQLQSAFRSSALSKSAGGQRAAAAAASQISRSLQHARASHGGSLSSSVRVADSRRSTNTTTSSRSSATTSTTTTTSSSKSSSSSSSTKTAAKSSSHSSSKHSKSPRSSKSRDMSSSPSPSKQEEQDSPSRPRLTSQQTAYLEEYYSHTPRPSTQDKRQHAMELGLTQEKINNWFQNRRAKTKQQNRTRRELRELSIWTPDDGQPPFEWFGYPSDHMDSIPPTSTHQFGGQMPYAINSQGQMVPVSDAAIAQMQAMSQGSGLAFVGGPSPDSTNVQQLMLAQGLSPLGMEQSLENSQQFLDTDLSSASSGYPDSLFDYATALSSSSNSNSLLEGHFQPTMHNLPDSQQLAQHNAIHFNQHATSHMKPDHSRPSRLQMRAISNNISNLASPHDSPSPVTIQPMFGSGRRDSVQSELASNFNTVHLNRAPSQQTSDEELFKTPEVPDLNLAARRKRQRPAALLSMRTVSSSAASERSPQHHGATLPAAAVRRIKSTGNSLNVISGRIQKNSFPSALRSPISNLAMQEDPEDDDDDATTQFATDAEMAYASQAALLEGQNCHSWATSPSSVGVPPLSASFTQNSYEDPLWLGSPPATPFLNHNMDRSYSELMNNYDNAQVPQSAPANITGFTINHSPSMSGTPAAQCFTQPQLPVQLSQTSDILGYIPQAVPHLPSQMGKVFEADHQQPRIVRSDSGAVDRSASRHGNGQFTFFAAPQPPPQKELEVVLANFPSPETKPLSLLKGGGPMEFTFQNSGPKDFSSAED